MDTTSDKKRKADAAEVADRSAKKSAVAAAKQPAPDPVSDGFDHPEIPAPVWGHVMDYLPYTDVLKCLLVNRLLSFEAPKYVDRISIYKPSEVVILPLVRNRRRFENATEIRFFCLIKDHKMIEGREHPIYTLCADVLRKVVPFLELFPKLEVCFCSGYDPESKMYGPYYMCDCRAPLNHVDHYRNFIKEFSLAFQKGTLSNDLLLQDVITGVDRINCCRRVFNNPNNECPFCNLVLNHFPLNVLFQLSFSWKNTCLGRKVIEQKIRETIWPESSLMRASTCFIYQEVIQVDRIKVGEEHRKKFEAKGALDPDHLYFLPKSQSQRLKLMLDMGIGLQMRETLGFCTRKELYLEHLNARFSLVNGGYALTKASYDILIEARYPFESSDFVVVDETIDPGGTLQERIKKKDYRSNHDDERSSSSGSPTSSEGEGGSGDEE